MWVNEKNCVYICICGAVPHFELRGAAGRGPAAAVGCIFAANSTNYALENRISAENNIQLAGFIASCCSLLPYLFGIENRCSKPHICSDVSSRAQNGYSQMFD